MKYVLIIVSWFLLSGCMTMAGVAGALTIAGGAATQYNQFQKELQLAE